VISPWITPLPPYRRKDCAFQHVVVVVDRLTNIHHCIAIEGLGADKLAERFIEQVYSLHSLSATIISNRGTQFISTLWRALLARLAITLKPSSAFHPWTNGQIERINAKLEQYLRLFVDWAQDDWMDWLPRVEFVGNNTTSEMTIVSPFFTNYGFHPCMEVDLA
jgi:transposase InsO family protein